MNNKDYKYYVELCDKQDYERIFPNEEEMEKSRKFYKENGFHYEDIWNLDRTIIKFILPRLAYFRDNYDGTPKITEILNGFEIYLIRDEQEWTQEDKIAIDKAWDNFRKYFGSFWN